MLIYEALREDILWLNIAPGSAIDEVALAKRFDVSRTPIREALLLLKGEWLVQFLANRTSIVAPLSLNNSGQYFDSHLVLGRATVRAAALSGRADKTALRRHLDKYRKAISASDHNTALRSSLDLMRDITALPRSIFLERYFSHSLDSGIRMKIMHYFPNASAIELADAGDLMLHLIDAIAAQDPAASDEALRVALTAEINIISRSHQPAFGDKMDIDVSGPVS